MQAIVEKETAVESLDCREICLPDHRRVTPFKCLKIKVNSDQEFRTLQRLLLRLGYAWNFDEKTIRLLQYQVVPAFIWAHYDGNLYFESPDESVFQCVGLNHVVELEIRKNGLFRI